MRQGRLLADSAQGGYAKARRTGQRLRGRANGFGRGFAGVVVLPAACLLLLGAAPEIDVHAAGARCDGVSDDSAAFQKAAEQAAQSGLPLRLSGACVVDRPVALQAVPSGLFRLEGHGAAIVTHGNGFLRISPPPTRLPLTDAPNIVVQIDGLRIVNKTPGRGGTAIEMDGTQGGAFFGSSLIGNLFLDNFQTGILLQAAGGFTIDNVEAWNIGNAAVELAGPRVAGRETYSPDDVIRRLYVVGANVGVLFSGGVQGAVVDTAKVLQSRWGIFADDTADLENILVRDSYLEGSEGGLLLRHAAFVQVMDNSFDTLAGSERWQAITLGTANDPLAGVIVKGNMVFGIGGQGTRRAATIIQVYGINGAVVSDNQVTGLAVSSHCIQAGAPPGHAEAGDVTTIDGNACWAAGDIASSQGAIARGNVESDGRGKPRQFERN